MTKVNKIKLILCILNHQLLICVLKGNAVSNQKIFFAMKVKQHNNYTKLQHSRAEKVPIAVLAKKSRSRKFMANDGLRFIPEYDKLIQRKTQLDLQLKLGEKG